VVAGRIAYPKLYAPNPDNRGGGDEATIVRYAADGTILWQRDLDMPNDKLFIADDGTQYFTPALCHVNQIATDAQGNVFVAGGKFNPNTNAEPAFAAKFSPAGDLIWQNAITKAAGTYGDPPQQYETTLGPVYNMGLTSDGGVIVINTQGRPSGYSILTIAKFDGSGAVSFYKAYEHPAQYTPTGPVCQSKDGSRYVATIRYPLSTDGVGSPVNGTLVLIFDLNGNLIGQRGWASPDNAQEEPLCLIATADGGFATMARRGDGAGVVVRKFNADASATTLEKSVYMTPRFSGFAAQSLSETADGGLLIGGRTSYPGDTGSATDVLLLKVSAAGVLEFASRIGGRDSEGYTGTFGTPESAYAVPTTDGGYGFACYSHSYATGSSGKPDWWIGKTDANRRIRNFGGTMADEDLSIFAVVGTPHAPIAISDYKTPNYTAGPVVNASPVFDVLDPSTFAAPDAPTVVFQASGPRVVSSRTAEAVVGQHFAYHIIPAFFDAGATLTYSVSGLPQGFVFDTKTGVISGVPAPGSETTSPIVITLQVTDGVDTASATLGLTIGDGIPAFTVNGSDKPTDNLADTVLSFSVQHPGALAGRLMTVQSSTTPADEGSWRNLPNGTNGDRNGYMTFDIVANRYALSSTNYPLENGIYFRAHLKAPGQIDKSSNVVGPFNLAAGKPHLGPTVLYLATNGAGAEMRFRVTESAPPSGIALRIQSTTTPAVEGSWTDLPDGNSGHMLPYADPTQFYLDSAKYPAGEAVYFRAVASAQGYIDSLSNGIGVRNVVNGTPPSVDVLPPRFDQLLAGTGSGTNPNDPLLVSVGTFKLGAQATSSEQKPIKRLVLLYDGVTINDAATSGDHFQMDYTTSVPGDHVVKAAATDERGVIGYADPIYLRVVPSGGKLFKMVGSGSWNNPANWHDGLGNNGIPGANDFAIIEGYDASITQNVTVYAIALVSGSMNGAGGALTVSRFLSIVTGQLKNIDLTIDSGGVMTIGDADVPISGSVTNNGKIRLTGRGSIAPVPNGPNTAGMRIDGTLAPNGFFDGIAAFFKNAGEFIFHHPSVKPKPKSVPPAPPAVPRPRSVTAAGMTGSGKLVSDIGSAIVSKDGASAISHDGGSLLGNAKGTLIGNDGASLIGNDGASVIGNDGASLLSENGLGLLSDGGIGIKVRPNGSFASASTQAETAAATSGYVQTGGETNLDNVMIVGPVSIEGGVLSGSGIIIGSLTNNGGYIAPGHSAGIISVTGNFTQGAQGTLVMEAAGGEANQFDRLQISGAATLGGKLDIRTINSYVPLANDPFCPIGYSSVSGSFSFISGNVQLTPASGGSLAVIDPAKPNPSTGQPLNIATRMSVQTGDNVLIAGFIVTGPSGSTKKVLIRGMGPSLAQFGVSGTLSDPFLELHKPDGSVVSNDNWQQGDTSQIPNGFAPNDQRESVLVATLTPGNYSAVVKGAHGETGVGIAELYDLDAASPATLANISTRGFINTGDDVMIGGFIIGGTEPAKILVRVTGPTLTDFGVPGALADPTLELHDSNGSTINNDDWRESQEADIIATTIPPNKDREPAILATLAPGNYTAVVRGKNNTTGIGLVEAYNLQ
jgi:hypothetical protein